MLKAEKKANKEKGLEAKEVDHMSQDEENAYESLGDYSGIILMVSSQTLWQFTDVLTIINGNDNDNDESKHMFIQHAQKVDHIFSIRSKLIWCNIRNNILNKP